MTDLLGISFVHPWLLAGFLILPLLWWLLRVTPPAPRLMRFPAIRLLFGLSVEEQTSSDAPWWLVLLRLLVVSLLILSFAEPRLRDDYHMVGSGPLILVIEDDWAAAPGWNDKVTALQNYVDDAAQAGKSVVILTSAPSATDGEMPEPLYLAPAQAKEWLAALEPKPWPGNLEALDAALASVPLKGAASIIWASDGLWSDETTVLADRLRRLGAITLLRPAPMEQPVTVIAQRDPSGLPKVTVRRSDVGSERQVALLARARDGRVLSRNELQFKAGQREATMKLSLPAAFANQIAQIDVERAGQAGGVYLLDASWNQLEVGIVEESFTGGELTLLSEGYYLSRAVDPFASTSQAPLNILLRAGHDMLLLPDAVALTTDEQASLKDWVQNGGVLVRFAGPRLAAHADQDLLPLPLRQGGRARDGALQWDDPAHLGRFSNDGPFAGLAVSDDVTVTRQVLAEPGPDVEAKIWAELDDGTPLVTGTRRGKGWLVLFHTSANASWSNLALSGTFVEMLQRLGGLPRGGVVERQLVHETLPPMQSLSAFGDLIPPYRSAKSYPALDDGGDPVLSASLPPGYYGNEDRFIAMNLGEHVQLSDLSQPVPAWLRQTGYDSEEVVDLRGIGLAVALLLILLDAWLSLWLRGQLGWLRHMRGAASIVLVVTIAGMALPGDLRAQTADRDAFALAASTGTVLAYIRTGDPELDRVSEEGLRGLATILNQRTAVEASQPMGVDIVRDDLSFFPLLYWPIGDTQPPLSQTAADNLNQYMARGGTLLIDLRQPPVATIGTDSRDRLRRLTYMLDLPPLTVTPSDHVLTRSFYLLQDFPGRWSGGDVWVEPSDSGANDGVSRVIVGSQDWAGAWAMDEYGRPRYPVVPGGERQREMAYRFGVNVVMYMLTGNYKSDQVHVPAILERLGQ